MQIREPLAIKAHYVFNMNVVDKVSHAVKGAQDALTLARKLIAVRDTLEESIPAVIEAFEAETQIKLLFSVYYI